MTYTLNVDQTEGHGSEVGEGVEWKLSAGDRLAVDLPQRLVRQASARGLLVLSTAKPLSDCQWRGMVKHESKGLTGGWMFV